MAGLATALSNPKDILFLPYFRHITDSFGYNLWQLYF